MKIREEAVKMRIKETLKKLSDYPLSLRGTSFAASAGAEAFTGPSETQGPVKPHFTHL